METIKTILMSIVGAYAMMFQLPETRVGRIYLAVYLALSLVCSIAFIMTFPWLALATFVMGFGMPFILLKH